MQGVLPRLAALILLIALGLAGIWVALWGSASLFALYGNSLARDADDEPGLERALKAYSWAVRLDGLNPDYVQRQGRILEWLSQGWTVGHPRWRVLLESALSRYRAAAELRPSWPYVHPDIARVKLKLGEIDAEFYASVSRAIERGRWSSRVQFDLLEVAFSAWSLLDSETREAMRSVLERELRLRPTRIIDAAVRAGRRDLVEQAIGDDKRLRNLVSRSVRALNSEEGL